MEGQGRRSPSFTTAPHAQVVSDVQVVNESERRQSVVPEGQVAALEPWEAAMAMLVV